jgi:hypothetical protein
MLIGQPDWSASVQNRVRGSSLADSILIRAEGTIDSRTAPDASRHAYACATRP